MRPAAVAAPVAQINWPPGTVGKFCASAGAYKGADIHEIFCGSPKTRRRAPQSCPRLAGRAPDRRQLEGAPVRPARLHDDLIDARQARLAEHVGSLGSPGANEPDDQLAAKQRAKQASKHLNARPPARPQKRQPRSTCEGQANARFGGQPASQPASSVRLPATRQPDRQPIGLP